MERRIYYYNCFITHNDRVTNIHISELLNEIILLNPNERLKSIRQGNLCLMHMKPPNTNIDHNDRKVVFGKFREMKPFLGNIGTDRIDEIQDDVLELTSVFYRRNSRLLLVEYNHNGARPNALQNYLSSFLPVSENDNWTVQLEPIEPDLGFQDIANSNEIKKVEFRVDLTSRNRTIYLNEENDSVLGEILSKSIETHNGFGANVAYVGFGNGRKRRDIIDAESLVRLLRGLDLEGDIFDSVKVTYRSPTTRKVEEVDIKDQGVLKEIVDLEGDGWEYICDYLENRFYSHGRLGQYGYREYEYFPDNLPELIVNNTIG
ncbi:DUF6731 family protein [Bacillaceae bacterium W0354]